MKDSIITQTKQCIDLLKGIRYNNNHAKLAKSILRIVESMHGKTDPKLIKQSNTYAREVLGWKGYAPWLITYSAIAGEFKEGWIPENYFGHVIVPKLQGEVGKTSFLKPLSRKIFASDVYPDLAYYVNGSYFDRNLQLASKENIKALLFQNDSKVVFKLNNSFQGRGIFVITAQAFDSYDFRALGEGVFQHYIRQHAFFDKIMPNSVATIRILTVLDNAGKASVRAAYLRVGREKDSHVKSNSQISIPIDLITGKLGECGYQQMCKKSTTHPDTGFAFNQQAIPDFQALIQLGLELQQQMAFVKCIGWDMVVDRESRIQVMEWNGFHTGIGFAELTQGPCFKDLGWEDLWK